MFYQIENLGDDDIEQVEYQSTEFSHLDPSSSTTQLVEFQPRELRNVSLVDEMESLVPLTDFKVLNLTGEDTPQIYTLCGKGPRSSFRILRHGLEVSELAVSELPGSPTAVWTLRASTEGILSFVFSCKPQFTKVHPILWLG